MTLDAAPLIVIQARSGSTRLPKKVLADLCGEPVIGWVIHRCRRSRLAGGIALVTSTLDEDDMVAALGSAAGVLVHRGSAEDVLLRYVEAARRFNASAIVRVTADCPFIDPAAVDDVIDHFRRRPADYVAMQGHLEGVGAAELVRRSALERALAGTTPNDTAHREHVITYLTDHPALFDLSMPPAAAALRRPNVRFSVDTPEDLARARRLASSFHPSRDFTAADILAWHDRDESTT